MRKDHSFALCFDSLNALCRKYFLRVLVHSSLFNDMLCLQYVFHPVQLHLIFCRMVCSFVEEIFANKVFVPAINAAARPVSLTLVTSAATRITNHIFPLYFSFSVQDFMNNFLFNIFDKNSVSRIEHLATQFHSIVEHSFIFVIVVFFQRLESVFDPLSKDVIFLSKWALPRSRQRLACRPLDIPLPKLLDPEHHLHTFIQFMRDLNDVHIVSIYITLSKID